MLSLLCCCTDTWERSRFGRSTSHIRSISFGMAKISSLRTATFEPPIRPGHFIYVVIRICIACASRTGRDRRGFRRTRAQSETKEITDDLRSKLQQNELPEGRFGRSAARERLHAPIYPSLNNSGHENSN